mmetsp:Transcript_106150/g.331115  ORF Transcript_106150/g.331115 Transcript_106150/m.331115 type:complete len:327 (+) Transcript_106150:232-1212(+)
MPFRSSVTKSLPFLKSSAHVQLRATCSGKAASLCSRPSRYPLPRPRMRTLPLHSREMLFVFVPPRPMSRGTRPKDSRRCRETVKTKLQTSRCACFSARSRGATSCFSTWPMAAVLALGLRGVGSGTAQGAFSVAAAEAGLPAGAGMTSEGIATFIGSEGVQQHSRPGGAAGRSAEGAPVAPWAGQPAGGCMCMSISSCSVRLPGRAASPACSPSVHRGSGTKAGLGVGVSDCGCLTGPTGSGAWQSGWASRSCCWVVTPASGATVLVLRGELPSPRWPCPDVMSPSSLGHGSDASFSPCVFARFSPCIFARLVVPSLLERLLLYPL